MVVDEFYLIEFVAFEGMLGVYGKRGGFGCLGSGFLGDHLLIVMDMKIEITK